MKALFAALAATGVLLAPGVQANDKLAQSAGCNTCHQMEKKIIGPSYKDIAAKYRSDKGAEAKLIAKVKQGGKGVWGEVPMPPNAHVKDEDIKSIVHWIVTLK